MENEIAPADPKAVGMSDEQVRLWKRRYQTACDAYKNGDHKKKCENIVRYLHNDFSAIPESEEVFFNQFFIGLKTLVPLVIANNPFVAVNPENDLVFEYDGEGNPIVGPDGQPVRHDIGKTAATIQGLLKKRLKTLEFKSEMRTFLRNAIAFNRGIYLVGHTINSEYDGAFNKPFFHAYIKSVSPRRIKRQPGTTRIDEGTYFFYEYELPLSHLKKDRNYDQELLKQCREEVLDEIKIESDDESFKDQESGHFDDVKYIKLRNAYDLLTGEVFVFGAGCDKPLKTIQPDYSFKNPAIEFIPNETFQPDQKEPISDLMMIENIVKKAQKIIKKVIRHVENFNTGYNIEDDAIDKKQRQRIEKSLDRAFWVFKKNAITSGKVQRREEVEIGQTPFNLIQFLFDYIEKTLSVYNFQQGGRTSDDETATKTQAKVQTSQIKSGDMSDVFTDANNKALDKFLEVLIRTTDTKEVVECIGDAGEVEYRPFNGDDAKRGQYYCEVDLQSMGKVNEDLKIQQGLKFYEILKSDPDPLIQQKFDKLKLVEKLAKGLHLGNEGIIRRIPDTQGMDEQKCRDFLKQQMIKAQAETMQAVKGADPLPPSPDDDDDIHLSDHMPKAQELKAQAASNPDPQAQAQIQAQIDRLIRHMQPHLDRKRQKEEVEKRMNPQPQTQPPPMPQGAPRQQVADNPQMMGQVLQ